MRLTQCCIGALCATSIAIGQEVVSDSLDVNEKGEWVRRYWVEPVVVTAQRIDLGGSVFMRAKTDTHRAFVRDGFSLVHRGSALASDLYADGMKRGDLTVVIEGERYPSACPNRMDTPCTRVNPLEIRGIELSKSCSSAASGLGGEVVFHRDTPSQERALTAGMNVVGGAVTSMDLTLATDARGYRLTGRSVSSEPHLDAAGRNFKELYGYRGLVTQRLHEVSLFGRRGDWSPGASVSFTEDISFPYLLMDERTNDFFSTFLGWREHKTYLNHTWHTMDNDLRGSASLMSMVTKAENWTFGITGPGYEVFYRRWDADNTIAKVGGPRIDNHMIPDLRRVSARLHRAWTLTTHLSSSARLGFQRDRMNDGDRLGFHRALHPDAQRTRNFVIFCAGLSAVSELSEHWSAGLLLETVSEPPQPQELYVGVQKLGEKPWWVGNPGLDAPIRSTIRAQLRSAEVRAEAYLSRVDEYAALAATRVGTQKYLTYNNIDALITGLNLRFNARHLDLDGSISYGQNLTGDHALAEIQPFNLEAKLKSPVWHGVGSFLRWHWAAEQDRIDETLNEAPTPSWQRVDWGLHCVRDGWSAQFEIENLLDELYYQHLSYTRNPFASGLAVMEPGTTVRLSIFFGP